MRALAIRPGSPGVREVDRPQPAISSDHDVALDVVAVGICGTDREEVAGGRARAPAGQPDLVIGHEMIGRVVDVGAQVSRVTSGATAVFTVRRGCGACAPCRIGRPDMCMTGRYRERGIWGLDGYQTERVVDSDDYVVPVPEEIAAIGVLIEPLSIVEKAIDEAIRVQTLRRPDAATMPDWIVGQPCLVAGLGPVGLLAAMVLALRGARVYGLDVVDAQSVRPAWLRGIGGEYIDGRQVPVDRVTQTVAPMEVIVEAAGVASIEFNLLDALGTNGAYVLTGIPGGNRQLPVPAAALVRQMVLNNQIMLGSVNAARGHFQMAVDDLRAANRRWPDHTERLIQRYPVERAGDLFAHAQPDAIKEVIDWQGAHQS